MYNFVNDYNSIFSSKLEIVKCQTKAYLTLLELGMVLDIVRDDYPSEYTYLGSCYYDILCIIYRSCS